MGGFPWINPDLLMLVLFTVGIIFAVKLNSDSHKERKRYGVKKFLLGILMVVLVLSWGCNYFKYIKYGKLYSSVVEIKTEFGYKIDRIKIYQSPDFPEKIIEDGTLTGWDYSLAVFFYDGFDLFVSAGMLDTKVKGWGLGFPFCYGEKTGKPVIVIVAQKTVHKNNKIDFIYQPICAYYAEDLSRMAEPYDDLSAWDVSNQERRIRIVEKLKPELDKIIEKIVKFYSQPEPAGK